MQSRDQLKSARLRAARALEAAEDNLHEAMGAREQARMVRRARIERSRVEALGAYYRTH